TFQVNDGSPNNNLSNTQSRLVNVISVAAAPTVNPTSTTTNEDTPTGLITITPAASDQPTGSTYHFRLSGLSNGMLYKGSALPANQVNFFNGEAFITVSEGAA